MSKYPTWVPISKGLPLEGEVVMALKQLAPGAATTKKSQCYYQDNTFFNVQTNEPVDTPVIAWAPLTPSV